MKDKGSLRTYYSGLLKGQAPQERLRKSEAIAHKLFALAEIKKAKTILFYASLPYEVDTFAMMRKAIELNKKVALPIIQQNQKTLTPTAFTLMEDLREGTYGIMEPAYAPNKAVSLEAIDAVIVPALAFDADGHRLGRGAGYYDRFLGTLPKDTSVIGLAFDFQLADCLPADSHDVAVGRVLTNS